ncbi:MAG: hypothetical protein ACHQM6_10750 [Candidatus Kapaibacterium sp.]
MKYFLAVFILGAFIISQTESAFAGPKIDITIKLIKKCEEKFGWCGITIGIGAGAIAVPGSHHVNIVAANNSVTIEFLDKPENAEDIFGVAENFTFSNELANMMGYKSVSLLQGDYKVDWKKGRFGSVTIKARTTSAISRGASTINNAIQNK